MSIKDLIDICLRNNIEFSIVPIMPDVSDNVYDIRFINGDKVSHFTGTWHSLEQFGEGADNALEIQILQALTGLFGITKG